MLFCTYNIHYGVGADGKYDVARIADASDHWPVFVEFDL